MDRRDEVVGVAEDQKGKTLRPFAGLNIEDTMVQLLILSCKSGMPFTGCVGLKRAPQHLVKEVVNVFAKCRRIVALDFFVCRWFCVQVDRQWEHHLLI